ncbi:unnamed protein product [Lathyrus sativus]|nr:unnamed protein product [Lathyrus sativus]
MINHGMLFAFVERWHLETLSFHLPYGEMSITLDNVSCLLHLLIRGQMLDHSRNNKDKAMKMTMTYMEVDLGDACEVVSTTVACGRACWW